MYIVPIVARSSAMIISERYGSRGFGLQRMIVSCLIVWYKYPMAVVSVIVFRAVFPFWFIVLGNLV